MVSKQIKKILVPLDGSPNSIRGLDKAISVARACHATISVIYVKSVPGIYALHPLGFMSVGHFKETEKFLKSAKVRAAKKGILLTYKMIGGDPGYDLVRYAHNKKNKIDMIVLGARGRSRVKEIFLGSVSNYVVHKSKLPVLIVK